MNMSWRKSSYSTNNGGACVEIGLWRKSGHSSNSSRRVAVRDTKDNGHGLVLRFTPAAWQGFTAKLK
jgi:hypothetical protein